MSEVGRRRWLRLPVGEAPMDVLEARPASPWGAVVLLHEAWGVTPYTESVADGLASLGLHTMAPDLLHRDREPHPIPYGQLDRLLPAIERMRDDDVLADLVAVRGVLADEGWRPKDVAIIGFCLGGRFAFLSTLEQSWGAAVSFYPGGIVTPAFGNLPALVDRASDVQAPWLGLFGDEDDTIAVADVEVLRGALAAAWPEVDVVRYAGAGHAFHNDRRPSYAEVPAMDAWSRATGWVRRHLAGSGRLPTGW